MGVDTYDQRVHDHELFGVSPNASDEEIRQKYRSLVAIFHPDRFETGSAAVKAEATRRMAEINDAYGRLKRGQSSPPPAASRAQPRTSSPPSRPAGDRPPSVPLTNPTGSMFVSSFPALTLEHPLTLIQAVTWPAMEHPNVLWFGGGHRDAFALLKRIGRSAGWSISSDGPNMTIMPSRLAVRRRALARARPMAFGAGFVQGSAGTAVTIFGSSQDDLRRFFDLLRSSGLVEPR